MTDIPPPAPSSPAIEACKRDRLKEILAYGALGYLALFTTFLFFKGLPTGDAGAVLDTLAGGSLLLTKDAYGFVFGSSQGSQDKTAALAAQPAPLTPPPTTPTA